MLKAYKLGKRIAHIDKAQMARRKSIMVDNVEYESITNYLKQTGMPKTTFYRHTHKVDF